MCLKKQQVCLGLGLCPWGSQTAMACTAHFLQNNVRKCLEATCFNRCRKENDRKWRMTRGLPVAFFQMIISVWHKLGCQKTHRRAGKASTRLQGKHQSKWRDVGEGGVNVVTGPSQHAAAGVGWGRCSPFKLRLSPPAGHFLCYLHFYAGSVDSLHFWRQNGLVFRLCALTHRRPLLNLR